MSQFNQKQHGIVLFILSHYTEHVLTYIEKVYIIKKGSYIHHIYEQLKYSSEHITPSSFYSNLTETILQNTRDPEKNDVVKNKAIKLINHILQIYELIQNHTFDEHIKSLSD